MRNVSTFVIVGALVVVVALALFIRAERPREMDTTQEASPPQQGRESSKGTQQMGAPGQGDAQTAETSRRARVQERLARLRSDAEERKLDPMAAQKRDLPNLPTPKGEVAQKEEEEEPDPEDEGLKQTILNDPDPEERASAVFMLSGAEDQDTMRVLVKALDDPDAEVRLAVVEALGDYTDEISPDVLTPALRDPDAEVRFEAVGVLADIETPEARTRLNDCLNDPDEDVRELCQGALEMADEETAKPPPATPPAPAR